MRLHLASDDQLKNIIKYDIDIPGHLLAGVVTEMLNRNLLEGLVKKVIMAQFTEIKIATKVLKTSAEDIFQFCRMKIFEAISQYKQGLSPFSFFAYRFVLSSLKDLEKKAKAEMRKVYKNIQSVDVQLDSGETFADLLPNATNVEREVIKKISLEEKMEPLNEQEKLSFLLYAEGYSANEIAHTLGVSLSTGQRRVTSALSKMCGKKINLSELGFVNYRKGA